MANERKNRRATVVKKEPSFAIASSAVAAEPGEGDDADRWIGIDMAKALPGLAITESMQIIIEGVPDGARFSAGRNNGGELAKTAGELQRNETMLVLSRKKNESIVINNDITIVVVEIRGDKVRLGVEAPKEVPVHRREVYDAIKRNEQMTKGNDPSSGAQTTGEV